MNTLPETGFLRLAQIIGKPATATGTGHSGHHSRQQVDLVGGRPQRALSKAHPRAGRPYHRVAS